MHLDHLCLLLTNKVLRAVLDILTCVHTTYNPVGFYSWRILAGMMWWHLNNNPINSRCSVFTLMV